MTLLEQAVANRPDTTEYINSVISFNVKVRLAALRESQTALGDYLGIKRASMSQKMTGRSSWYASDLVKTARFLQTNIESLTDDALMKQMAHPDTKSTSVGSGPRCFVEPCAPRGTRTHNPRLKRTLL
ncbi:helix-turn-helix transcriptional regulator, partial [uncultured Bifidobacterium sp.]|uniref:helix-turn-helix domain-containing protein n=1 Tax=uncultured Bifidobacterium sp. TaxID=165187 RepID=UPI0025D436C7